MNDTESIPLAVLGCGAGSSIISLTCSWILAFFLLSNAVTFQPPLTTVLRCLTFCCLVESFMQLVGSVRYLLVYGLHFDRADDAGGCGTFFICVGQSAGMVFATSATCLWIMVAQVALPNVLRKKGWMSEGIPWPVAIVCFVLPAVVVTVALCKSALGEDDTITGPSFCWLSTCTCSSFLEELAWGMACGKGLEILTGLSMFNVFYVFSTQFNEGSAVGSRSAARQRFWECRSFALLPVIYIFIRTPGLCQFFTSLHIKHIDNFKLDRTWQLTFLTLQSLFHSSFGVFLLIIVVIVRREELAETYPQLSSARFCEMYSIWRRLAASLCCGEKDDEERERILS